MSERKSMVNRVTVACGVSILVSGGIFAEACGGDDTGALGGGSDASADGTFDSGGGDSGGRDSGGRDSGSGDSGGGDAGAWCGVESDGGTLCPRFEWLDSDAGSCGACPSPTFACAAITDHTDGGASSSPYYNHATHTVIARLAPGTAQVMSGTVTIPMGECFVSGQNLYDGGTQTFPLTVTGDTLESAPINDGGGGNEFNHVPCGVLTYVLADACCTTHIVQTTQYTDSESFTFNNPFCDAGQ